MRALAVIALVGICSVGLVGQASAQEQDKCDLTETWFKFAIDSRILGESKAAVRRSLQQQMGERKAANELADFVYMLPKEQLTPDLVKLARAQCEAIPAE